MVKEKMMGKGDVSDSVSAMEKGYGYGYDLPTRNTHNVSTSARPNLESSSVLHGFPRRDSQTLKMEERSIGGNPSFLQFKSKDDEKEFRMLADEFINPANVAEGLGKAEMNAVLTRLNGCLQNYYTDFPGDKESRVREMLEKLEVIHGSYFDGTLASRLERKGDPEKFVIKEVKQPWITKAKLIESAPALVMMLAAGVPAAYFSWGLANAADWKSINEKYNPLADLTNKEALIQQPGISPQSLNVTSFNSSSNWIPNASHNTLSRDGNSVSVKNLSDVDDKVSIGSETPCNFTELTSFISLLNQAANRGYFALPPTSPTDVQGLKALNQTVSGALEACDNGTSTILNPPCTDENKQLEKKTIECVDDIVQNLPKAGGGNNSTNNPGNMPDMPDMPKIPEMPSLTTGQKVGEGFAGLGGFIGGAAVGYFGTKWMQSCMGQRHKAELSQQESEKNTEALKALDTVLGGMDQYVTRAQGTQAMTRQNIKGQGYPAISRTSSQETLRVPEGARTTTQNKNLPGELNRSGSGHRRSFSR